MAAFQDVRVPGGCVPVLLFVILASALLEPAMAIPGASQIWDPTTVTPGSDEMKLGRGYQLQNTDVLKPGFGAVIIEPSSTGDCFVETPLREEASSISSYQSTEEFRKALANEASLSASYGPVSLDASVKAATSSESSKEMKVAELKGYTYRAAVAVDDSCLSSTTISDRVKKEFEALPLLTNNATVQRVLTDADMRPYARFFQLFGNHVITGFYYGATYRYFATSTDTSETTAHELEINACLAVSGASASVKGCESFKNSDSNKATTSVSSSNVLKVGGDESDAIDDLSMSQYLQTGRNPKVRTPALYQFRPIWDILNLVYNDAASFSRLTALKAYYEGWIDQGCGTLQLNGVEQRRFVLEPYSPGDDMVFKCMWPPRGCLNDNGCAHRWQGGDDRCICCGPNCIVTPTGQRDKYVKREYCDPNRDNDDHYFDWYHAGNCPHNTCVWTGESDNHGCRCRNGNQWYLKWTSAVPGTAPNVEPVPPEDCNAF